MATAPQPTGEPDSSSSPNPTEPVDTAVVPAAPPSDLPTEPTLIDQRRYWASRAGQSIAQIAAKAKVSEEEVNRSIELVKIDNERYSAAAAGVAARKLLFAALPKIQSAVDQAL